MREGEEAKERKLLFLLSVFPSLLNIFWRGRSGIPSRGGRVVSSPNPNLVRSVGFNSAGKAVVPKLHSLLL